jgi:hypothetical protein
MFQLNATIFFVSIYYTTDSLHVLLLRVIDCLQADTSTFQKLLHAYFFFHPITGHEGPEGEKRYSSTLSLTSALDAGVWSTPSLGRFTPGKDPVPIV